MGNSGGQQPNVVRHHSPHPSRGNQHGMLFPGGHRAQSPFSTHARKEAAPAAASKPAEEAATGPAAPATASPAPKAAPPAPKAAAPAPTATPAPAPIPAAPPAQQDPVARAPQPAAPASWPQQPPTAGAAAAAVAAPPATPLRPTPAAAAVPPAPTPSPNQGELQRLARSSDPQQLQHLANDFATRAAKGVGCMHVVAKTGVQRRATYSIDRGLTAFTVMDDGGGGGTCEFSHITDVLTAADANAMAAGAGLGSLGGALRDRLVVVRHDPGEPICLLEAGPGERDVFQTCLRILRFIPAERTSRMPPSNFGDLATGGGDPALGGGMRP